MEIKDAWARLAHVVYQNNVNQTCSDGGCVLVVPASGMQAD